MSIRSSNNQLSAITEELLSHWEETEAQWDDVKSQEFKREYVSQLQPTINLSVEALEQLSTLLERVKRDCE